MIIRLFNYCNASSTLLNYYQVEGVLLFCCHLFFTFSLRHSEETDQRMNHFKKCKVFLVEISIFIWFKLNKVVLGKMFIFDLYIFIKWNNFFNNIPVIIDSAFERQWFLESFENVCCRKKKNSPLIKPTSLVYSNYFNI